MLKYASILVCTIIAAIYLWLCFMVLVFIGSVISEARAGEPVRITVMGIPSSVRTDGYFRDIRDPVHLVQMTFKGVEAQGSAVSIDEHHLLTSAHVIGDNMFVIVGSRRIPAKLVRKHDRYDLAMIEADVGCPCAKIGDLPAIDERIALVGFPLHSTIGIQIMSDGRMQGVTEDKTGLVITAPVAKGASGGGVFIRRGEWQLIGIIESYLTGNKGDAQLGAIMIAAPVQEWR